MATTFEKRIGIVNYDCGNLRSVYNAVEYLGFEYTSISQPSDLKLVKKLILPGVGKFDHAVQSLKKTGLFDAIPLWSSNLNNKLLGICLGMQLLCNTSHESKLSLNGLGLIPVEVESLRHVVGDAAKVPHMGWSEVDIAQNDIFQSNEKHDYYFVHSYAVVEGGNFVLARTSFDKISFASMIYNCLNVYGMQFHPEKSHQNGLNLLRDFLRHA